MGASVHLFVPFAAHLAPPEQRGRVVGTVFSGILLGILLARTFSGIVGAHLGWRAVYAIAAGMMLCIAILVQFLLPHSKPTRGASLFVALLKSTGQPDSQLSRAARIGVFRRVAFCCFTAFWTTLVFFLETPPYHYGSQAAGLFGLVGAAGAAAHRSWAASRTSAAPRIADRSRSAFSLRGLRRCCGCSGTKLAGLIVGVLLMDMGVQAGHVANQTRIYGLDPEARSRLNMFYMVCYFAGGAVGSFLRRLRLATGGWSGVCAFCAAVMCVALVSFTSPRRHGSSDTSPAPRLARSSPAAIVRYRPNCRK